MKKLILVLFLFTGVAMQSQILITLLLGDKLNSEGLEFGLEGGLNYTNIGGLETNNFARKWNLGFYFDIRLKDQWSIYTGVLVKSNFGVDKLSDSDLSKIGAKLYYEDDSQTKRIDGTYDQKINSFMLPALIKYKFKNHIYLEGGAQFALMYRGWVEFNSKTDDEDVIIRQYNTPKLNKIDAGVMLGLGYRLLKGTGLTLGAKYYYGFVNVYKDVAGSNNSSFFLKVNIPVGAGKIKKEKDKN